MPLAFFFFFFSFKGLTITFNCIKVHRGEQITLEHEYMTNKLNFNFDLRQRDWTRWSSVSFVANILCFKLRPLNEWFILGWLYWVSTLYPWDVSLLYFKPHQTDILVQNSINRIGARESIHIWMSANKYIGDNARMTFLDSKRFREK